MPVLNDLLTYLAAQSLGTLAVDLFLYGIPQDTPEILIRDAVLALIPVPGLPPLRVHDGFPAAVEQPMVQVLVRGTPYGFQSAMARAVQAWTVLGSITNQTLSGLAYLSVSPMHSPWLLRTDEQVRPYMVFTVRVMKAIG
jgi:hypothetical protein